MRSDGSHEREYLFIDGGCLRSSVAAISRKLLGDEHILQPHIPGLAAGTFAKVFYYDAIPGQLHNESQVAYEARVLPDHERIARIQAVDRVHVGLGVVVGSPPRQKGVDVRLAVDMMTHAFRGNNARATLFAADADFVPLVQALVAEGVHVTLWHPPQANDRLKNAADTARPFLFQLDHQCFTFDGVHPALEWASRGGATPQLKATRFGSEQYVGVWEDDRLTIYRAVDGRGWESAQMRASGAPLASAMICLGEVVGWDLSDKGHDWVVGG